MVLEWLNPNCPFSRRHAAEETMQTLADAHPEVVWLGVNSTSLGHGDHLEPNWALPLGEPMNRILKRLRRRPRRALTTWWIAGHLVPAAIAFHKEWLGLGLYSVVLLVTSGVDIGLLASAQVRDRLLETGVDFDEIKGSVLLGGGITVALGLAFLIYSWALWLGR